LDLIIDQKGGIAARKKHVSNTILGERRPKNVTSQKLIVSELKLLGKRGVGCIEGTKSYPREKRKEKGKTSACAKIRNGSARKGQRGILNRVSLLLIAEWRTSPRKVFGGEREVS